MSNTLALSTSWVEASNNAGDYYQWTWDPWQATTNTVTYYPYHWCTCHGCCDHRITLSLKEVDTLRRAAKGNKKLTAVLQKLTPKIEVEIDLDA